MARAEFSLAATRRRKLRCGVAIGVAATASGDAARAAPPLVSAPAAALAPLTRRRLALRRFSDAGALEKRGSSSGSSARLDIGSDALRSSMACGPGVELRSLTRLFALRRIFRALLRALLLIRRIALRAVFFILFRRRPPVAGRARGDDEIASSAVPRAPGVSFGVVPTRIAPTPLLRHGVRPNFFRNSRRKAFFRDVAGGGFDGVSGRSTTTGWPQSTTSMSTHVPSAEGSKE
jgi:hypothetical protein